jgi:hypothetical protein
VIKAVRLSSADEHEGTGLNLASLDTIEKQGGAASHNVDFVSVVAHLWIVPLGGVQFCRKRTVREDWHREINRPEGFRSATPLQD